MHLKSLIRPLFALIALLMLGACSSPLGSNSVEIATWEIDAQRVPCMGMLPTTCLRYRENGDTAWTSHFGDIEGFAYEPGFRYQLEVEIREVRNPPADGSSIAVRLLRLIDKRAETASL